LPRFFPRRTNVVTRWWATVRGHNPTPAKGCKFFTDNVLSISRDKRTDLISVMVDWRDRHEAASWATELVARVNAEMRSRAIATASQYTAFLEKEWASTQLVETREAIGQLIESEIRQRMIATVTTEYAFRTVDAAMPADPDDIYSPNRPLVLIGSVFGGLFLGCAFVLAWNGLKSGR